MIYLYYDNDGLDPSEEYYRKKKKVNDDDTYYPLEESEPPHINELFMVQKVIIYSSKYSSIF